MANKAFNPLSYVIGLKAIKSSLKKQQEDMLFQIWLTLYPNMNENNFISFKEFKEHNLRGERDENESKSAIDRLVESRRQSNETV